jgi:hypothetical protein
MRDHELRAGRWSWSVNPESALAVDVPVTPSGLKAGHQSMVLAIEDHDDPVSARSAPPGAPHPAAEVYRPLADQSRVCQVNRAPRIKHGCTQTLKILAWARIGRPVFIVFDVPRVFDQDVLINAAPKNPMSEKGSQPNDLPGRYWSDTAR